VVASHTVRQPYEPDDQHEKEGCVCCKQVLVCKTLPDRDRDLNPCKSLAVILSGRRSEDLRVALLKMDSIFVAAGRMNTQTQSYNQVSYSAKTQTCNSLEVPRVVFKASSASAWLKKQGVTHMPKKLQAQIDRIRDAQAFVGHGLRKARHL
jgi:hypothetical protein